MEKLPEFADRPINEASEDKLGRGRFVDNLARSLIGPDGKSTGLVVAVTGGWGSGKSSILNLLASRLYLLSPQPLTLKYEPWITTGSRTPIESFLADFRSLIEQEAARPQHSTADLVKELRHLAGKIAEYSSAIQDASQAFAALDHGHGILVAGGIKLATAFLRFFGKKKVDEPLIEIRNKIKESIRRLGRPIVILIDDIDRLPDEDIRSMAQLVKAVAHFEEVSYLLAYDAPRVAQALGGGQGDEAKGRAYLEKIVQLEIPLPYLHPDQTRYLLNSALGEISESVGLPLHWRDDEDYAKLLAIVIPLLVTSPRDISRALSSFHVRHRMIGEDVYWVDILGFCIFELKCPSVAKAISRKPWFAAVDAQHIPLYADYVDLWKLAAQSTYLDLAKAELSIAETTPTECARLLYFLFPHLSAEKADRPERSEHPDRINIHRPLLTLLALGLPSGAHSFGDISKVSSLNYFEIISSLEIKANEGSLLQFLDRFAEVHTRLPEAEWRNMWRALGTVLDMPLTNSDYDPGFKRLHLANRVNPIWREAVRRDRRLFAAAEGLVEQLMVDRSTELLSGILLPYAYDHGLFGAQQRERDEDLPISKHRVESYCRQVAERIAAQLLNRDAFVGLRGSYAIVLPWRTGAWQELHRLTVTGFIKDPRVLDAFVVLLCGENYQTDRKLVVGLLEIKEFAAQIFNRMHSLAWAELPDFVRDAYSKLDPIVREDTPHLA